MNCFLKAQPIDLADNMPGSLWTFTLGVFTGTRVGAGTTSNICAKIIGKSQRVFCQKFVVFKITVISDKQVFLLIRLLHEFAFCLQGSRGESDVHMLASRDYSVCQRGDVTVFLLRCAYDVGEVKSVRLWHDSSGDRPSW